VDNAVWDLLVAMHWSERVVRQLPEKKFWLPCSRDEALKRLATNLHFSSDVGESRENAIRQLFVDLWGYSDGVRLSARLLNLMADAENARRWCNQPGFEAKISRMTRELEEQFLRGDDSYATRN